MGVFNRFRRPRALAARVTRPTDDGRLERVRMHVVPDAVDDHHDERDDFEAAVRAHLRRLCAAADANVAALSTAEFDAALTSRLVSAEQLQSTEQGFSYAVPFAEQVCEVLTLDLPGAVVTLADSRIAETGRSLPSLVGTGRSNLLARLAAAEVDVQRIGEGDDCGYAVLGDSPYTASFARFLDRAARHWLRDVDDRFGFVFAVPDRHAVILRPCSTAAQVDGALELVAAQVPRMYDEGPSPVSAHTYHWMAGEVTCLTTTAEDGTVGAPRTEVLEPVLGLCRRAG